MKKQSNHLHSTTRYRPSHQDNSAVLCLQFTPSGAMDIMSFIIWTETMINHMAIDISITFLCFKGTVHSVLKVMYYNHTPCTKGGRKSVCVINKTTLSLLQSLHSTHTPQLQTTTFPNTSTEVSPFNARMENYLNWIAVKSVCYGNIKLFPHHRIISKYVWYIFSVHLKCSDMKLDLAVPVNSTQLASRLPL